MTTIHEKSAAPKLPVSFVTQAPSPLSATHLWASPQNLSLPHVKNEVVYARGTERTKRNVDMLIDKFHCPHFVTAIRESNLASKLVSSERGAAILVLNKIMKPQDLNNFGLLIGILLGT